MSVEDRQRWNQRYAQGAFADRTWPSVLLADWVERIPVGRALDIACGAGRNSMYLARRGFDVTGIDISRVGLEHARRSAKDANLDIDWVEADLESGALPVDGPFDLIVLFRYVNLELVSRLPPLLAPGGWLIVEEHLLAVDAENGPSNPAFRVAPGALRAAVGDLHIETEQEGFVNDPDGRKFPVARIVGHR
ncbi:MAG: class I SAM-dependent methyltransferase [Pseudomonadales bacterium]|nr:class I SAM-dependent methyltransferase [Pseudomonadales bacterium]MDP6472329.1 class I SAM-dependent methyltransferase [Pseudomonadales bacterium]MDP6828125.1 class I SAM-dependent methyltransferase [Pseudomonadales bacterium]MDP6971823.1 class I SAM-dependent methyltransferase [Pseudomonadales bacterium]